MDNLVFSSNRIWLSEDNTDPDSLYARILICDFSVNGNGTRLSRAHIDNWLGTLLNQPLVGKIEIQPDGSADFTGHNAHTVIRTDENGEEYLSLEFDTSAFGSIVDVSIMEVDGVESIVATAKIWKRFHDACQLILDRVAAGTLSTSWEIAVEEYDAQIEGGRMVKTIKAGRFIGHALLGATVRPAYARSGLLDVAEIDEDTALASAILKELMKEDTELHKEKTPEDTVVVSMEEPVVEEIQTEEIQAESKTEAVVEAEDVEPAALTVHDIMERLARACRDKADTWGWIMYIFPEEHSCWFHPGEAKETSCILFNYTVSGDEVEVDDGTPVELTITISGEGNDTSELNEALAAANATIESLKAEVASLEPYRAEHEAAEAERLRKEREAAVSELRAYAVASGRFSDEELAEGEIAEMIANLDKPAINALIAERLIAELNAQANQVDVSTADPGENVKVVLDPPGPVTNKAQIMRRFISK